jgi:hypothetical protein
VLAPLVKAAPVPSAEPSVVTSESRFAAALAPSGK